MGALSTREAEVDQLLRNEVFVDLHTVVHQAVRAGTVPGAIRLSRRSGRAGFERVADVGSGSEPVLEYEQWMTDGDVELLEEIAAYDD